MEEKVYSIVKKLLNYEFDYIINKFQFDKVEGSIKKDLIIEMIGILDNITIDNDGENNSIAITAIALLWELAGNEYNGLKDILIKMLARIGYAPSSIIIDSEYDKNEKKFSNLSSIINELSVSVNQKKYEIKVLDKFFLITDFQKRICDCFDENRILGISAPTSAGKSFILVLKSVEALIMNKSDIVYIVPTLSLVNQVSEDYKNTFKLFEYEKYEILNSYTPNSRVCEKKKVYVLTQERAIVAFSDGDIPFNDRAMLIVDEIQNLERVGNDSDTRSKILYDTIIEFRHQKIVDKIIISGPRIEDIDVLGDELFGVNDVKKIETNISPVLNLTYSISRIKNQYFFKQYCSLFEEPLVRRIMNPNIIEGYSQKRYDDKFMSYLNIFISRLNNKGQNIIFAPTSKTARDIALALAKEQEINNNDSIRELINYYAESVHPSYSLCKTLESSIAYHHGKLPAHVRRTIEKAASRKLISNIVCTTTLMQGVNLPAQNVIIRNPHLYVQKRNNSAELSSYEMTNLRGRAGRLLKDFIGRTYVLDESEFLKVEDDYNQIELFGEVSKEIDTNYGSKYDEYKDDIKRSLDENLLASEIDSKYGYLVTYIRQTILKFNNKAHEMLKEVGIEISKKEIGYLSKELEAIDVPKEICLKNRYWDPLVLDSLYKEKLPDLPQRAMERGVQTKLRNLLKFLRDNPKYSSIFNKHIKEKYRKGLYLTTLSKFTTNWLNQKSLKSILSEYKFNSNNIENQIEDIIGLLQNTISFDIPLLLRPIYDIKIKENMFLTYIETGAFKPITRKMIEIGIPRETAIYISENYFVDINKIDDDDLQEFLYKNIKKIYHELPYWIAIQIEYLL